MADVTDTALLQWMRYQQVRDQGHADVRQKSRRGVTRSLSGEQWDAERHGASSGLREAPRTDDQQDPVDRRERDGRADPKPDGYVVPAALVALRSRPPNVLTKVFRQISDSNQLGLEADATCSATASSTSRGFFDLRLDFTDSMMGEVRIVRLNPKNVLVDPDAEDYDPDEWNDVMTTKWLTWQDIEVLYGKAMAEKLKNRGTSMFPYGYDSIERERDRFGMAYPQSPYSGPWDQSQVLRNIRVIERQYKELTRREHFVDLQTGDLRPVPDSWDTNRKNMAQSQFNLGITKKLVKRIKWVVTADNIVLHEDWSPYKHFTVVPYFPYFRHGKTIGLVENLLDPQEYLNKVTSQELHVINTTANSGWKVKAGALTNMTIQELEQRGAETGLVVELNEMDGLDKINPNQTPTGLDRFSYKAEEHIKGISGVTDYQTGNAREDVSAKAVALNQNRGSMNLAGPQDALQRTDFLLARNLLDLVQEYYTEPRIMNITSNRITGDTEQVEVNQPDPYTGQILNDLTLGEFDVIVSHTPARETLEDSQFEQALSLRELGINIPDETLIENSRLNKRSDIIKQMREAQNSTETQYQQELQKMASELELAKQRAEAERASADAELKQAKAQMEQIKMQQEMEGANDQLQQRQLDMQAKIQEADLRRREADAVLAEKQREFMQQVEEFEAKMAMQDEEHAMQMEQDQEKHDLAMEHSNEQNKAKIAAQKTAAKAKPAPSKEKK
jgi:hypothetical protein